MTAKELKNLRRSDLLEMLLALKKENDSLRGQLKQAQQELASRKIVIDNAGSLAEAALQLNGIFEAAQAACDQYAENIRMECQAMEWQTREKCKRMIAQANARQETYAWLDELIGSPDESEESLMSDEEENE